MKIGSTTLGTIGVEASRVQQTTRALSRALERLSTGKRVSSPKDDPAAYSQSIRLDSQIRGLQQSNLQAAQTQSDLELRDSGLQSQLDLLQKMRELAAQASSTTLSLTDRDALTKQVQSLLDEYRRLSNPAKSYSLATASGASLAGSLRSSESSETLRWNAGTGKFSSRMTVASGVFLPAQSDPVDLNADGHLDLIGQNASNVLQTFFGNGSGSFTPGKTMGLGGKYTLGDIDRDGDQDVLTQSGNVLYGYKNDGAGNFSLSATYLAASGSNSTLVDINNDGYLDIVYNSSDSELDAFYTRLNNGDGTFGTAVADGGLGMVSLTQSITGIKGGDFNGDGKGDIAVSYTNEVLGPGLSLLSVFKGDGAGTYSSVAGVSSVSGGETGNMQIVDIDRDGRADIVLATPDGDRIVSYQNGSFTTKTLSTGSYVIQAVDLNRDGSLDLITGDNGTETTLWGRGGFNFQAGPSTSMSTYQGISVGDFNEDGVPDVLTSASPYGLLLYKGSAQLSDAESQISLADATKARATLEILDNAINQMTSNRGELSALHSRLDHLSAAQTLLADTLSEAKGHLVDADMAKETAEIVRLQILQQAQTAVRAQANSGLLMVLKLLGN